MLNYNSPIKENKNYTDLTIKEIYPVMKLNIRGKKKEFFTNAGNALNMILPTEPNTSTTSDKLTSIWLSPDEWMIFSNDIIEKDNNNYELENLLFANISKDNIGSISDVTDQYVMINLKGKKIFELLSSGCPFNFNEFKKKKGASAQTILNNIDVIIHHKTINSINLFVRRSFSEHLWSWMNDAASRL
jgi:sarcosine oxidase subunit gamma